MLINDLKEHINYLKKKDEIAIRKAERLVVRNSDYSKKFEDKASYINEVIKQLSTHICRILREFIANPFAEQVFEQPFSEALVISVLMDEEFAAFLIINNLINRTLNLQSTSAGQVKLRVYIAILNFDRYKKNKNSNK